VTAWPLPLAAAAFWSGLLAAPTVGVRGTTAGWLCVGAALLVASASLGGDRVDLADRAGLVDERFEPRSVSALRSGRATGRVPAALVLALALAGVAVLGVGWGAFAAHRVRGSALLAAAPRAMVLDGQVRTDPSTTSIGWWTIVDARTASWDDSEVALRESVWVSGRGDPPAIVRGDRVRVVGDAEAPGRSDFASMLRRRGIAVVLDADDVRKLGSASNPVVRSAQRFRAVVGVSIGRLFRQPESGLLLGLALGDDSRLDEGLARDFHATGLGHLLVVSGENVAMVLAPVLALALWLRLSRWPTFVLAAATVLFFVVLTGAEPSVLRAGVMAGLTLFGVLTGRPRSTAAVLSGAVLILLVVDPTLVWSVGFQLSVAATAGMVGMATTIARRIGFLPRPVALAAAATIAAQVAVTPILLFYFHEVPVVTVVANVLAFPAVSPALLLGLLAGAIGVAAPALARPVAALATLPMKYLELVADRLAKAPVPWITTGGGLRVLVVGGALVLALTWWLRERRRIPRPAQLAAALAFAVFVWSGAVTAGPSSGLVVRFFDVGQGDAALVSSPAGAHVLIDGGPEPDVVATKLAALGVKRLDLLVATHPHADHYVGFAEVLARIPVALVLDTGCVTPESGSVPYRSFLRAVHAEGVPEEQPVRGDVYRIGDLRFDVLSPDRCWSGTNSDPNNDSLVLRLSYGGRSVLFANEPEVDAQQVMLDDDVPFAADVLNVPHHGAATSLDEFLAAAGGRVAVVSVGPNSYGHPVPRTLDVLRASGARVFRTDRAGDVTIEFGETGMRVRTGTGRVAVVGFG
jgi:competence protein ComEC